TNNRPGIDQTKLVKEYGASVFPAEQAKEYGYIDGSGYSLQNVITMLVQKLGITDNFYQVVQLEKKTWFSELFQSGFSYFGIKSNTQIDLPVEFNPRYMNQFLYLYRPLRG